MKKTVTCLFTIALSTILLRASAQQKESYLTEISKQNHWVDSVYNKLSKHDRVAQLLFVRAHTNKGKAYEDSVGNVIKTEQVGGLVFFQGGPVRQAALTNKYQKLANVPLLIAMDGEWGLGMRLDSTISYPYQMTLGAIKDNALIYKMGQYIAYDFKRIGAQINLAPDMDVNNNPNNPVINYRSFGDNKYNVAAKGIAYFKGMQDAGLLATAKHFPGHGDTNTDSHLDLPLLPFTRQRLDTLEEYPFRQAVKAGLSGVMIAHMSIPALDSTRNLPSTLSRPIVTGDLKDSLGFKGLVMSDAMEMQAVVKYYPEGEADVRAFSAGNDIIELSQNSAVAIKAIRKAIRKDRISQTEFEAKVKKILAAKYWSGLASRTDVNLNGIISDLNRPAAKELVQQLCDNAITVLKGDVRSIQLTPYLRTAIVSIGSDQPTLFQNELAKWYPNCQLFQVAKNSPANELNNLQTVLQQYPQVFVAINDTRTRPGSKLDYSNDVKSFISQLAGHRNTAITVFANAYAIAGLPGIEKAGGLICCYQLNDEMQRSAVKVITQFLKPKGHLPVSINPQFPNGAGVEL